MSDTYRDALAEAATLRQELATSEAACASAMAEIEALREVLAKMRELEVLLTETRAERDAAREVGEDLVRERNEWKDGCKRALRDREVVEAEMDSRVIALGRELETLRTAVRHLVDCYRHDNLMGVIVGVHRLGEVLDGGT